MYNSGSTIGPRGENVFVINGMRPGYGPYRNKARKQ